MVLLLLPVATALADDEDADPDPEAAQKDADEEKEPAAKVKKGKGARFTALLGQAQRSIRIVDHKVADPMIISLLREKKDAGVTVEIVGTGGLGGLRSHGKMMLIDDNVAVIGSIALGSMSLDFRREVAIVIRQPECVRQLSEFFQSMAAAPKPAVPGGEAEETEDDN